MSTRRTNDLPDLLAFEVKMMNELPLKLCRERIERVKPFYIERQGLEGAKRIHTAMVTAYTARRKAAR